MIVSITMKRTVTSIAVLALVVGAFALAGCGGTKEAPGGPAGTGISEESIVADADRTAVMGAMKTLGIKYTADYVLMAYGESKDVVTVSGELVGPSTIGPGLASSKDAAATAYAEVVFKKDAKGAWGVEKATKKTK
jgi:hypothetical protein